MELIDKYMWYQEGPGVRKNQYTSSGVKLLNVANLVEGKIELSTSSRYISEDEANGRYNHFLVDEGDLIIASSGIQVSYFEKKMGIAEKKHLPLCMNTSTIRFKVLDKNITDIRYFMYFLKSNVFKKQIRKLITGSAQLNFGPSHLKKIKIEMPELKKQQEIVKKLDRVKKIIDIRNNQIIELNELIKSQFVEMFDNKNYPKIRLKEVLVQDQDVEKIENTRKEKFVTVGINGKGARERIIKDEKWPVPFVGYRVKGGQFIYSRIDARNGAFAIIPNYLNNAVVSKDFPIFDIDYNKIKPDILLFSLLEEAFIDIIKNSSFGATNRQRIKERTFLNYKIYLPPLYIQNQFSEIVKQIDKQKFEIEKSLKKIQELYESLMEKYFG